MSSTQHQLIEQCATRLRGIVEALDNIHDNTPLRWSTDLDDVHSSAESLLAMIKDQAPTQAAQGLAGAALAQPSPKCATCNDSGQIVVSGPHYQGEFQPPEYETEPCDMCAQPSPAQAEQAEAERPEVVARVVHSNPVVLGQCGPLNANDELMTVAQHAASVARWAEMFNRVEQQRDAALARVAELERQEPVATVAKVPGEDWNSLDFHRDLQDMQPGTKLYAAPVAQAQHSVPEKVRTLLSRAQCEIEHLAECLENVCEDEEDFDVREDVADGRVVAADIAHMLAAAPDKEVPQAWLDVQAERRRQVEAEGWTPEHDDEHADGQMAQAAGCYALHAGGIGTDWPDGRQNGSALFWPWDKDSWKPTTPRRDLVKACALALAEIERLDRAGISQSPQPGATTASS
ncbi:hypothetical protein [Pseudomonas aeruginosa]|uniref:hypothetical protein n=1 Tax=Pseudomonas aeruginosa TaxID=287 RepID=UPI001FC9C311|nr:hypothetical protein [Pseudomonas aeruginosa]